MTEENYDQLIAGLITSISTGVLVSLGKVPDPHTEKTTVNLDGAKINIDMLVALKEKTKGNLPAELDSFLSTSISNLQLAYVQIVNKSEVEEKEKASEEQEEDKKIVEDKTGDFKHEEHVRYKKTYD